MTQTMHVRSATPTDVRYDRREIDVLAVPYNTPTPVVDEDGRYAETITPGAFGKVSTRAGDVKVLRDHHPHRAVGRCATIVDDDPAGLRATLRISSTELGDETLVLAADGVLDVSVGFSSKGGDRWNRLRNAVIRTNCWLHELSLVPLAAYETAKVLAVRGGAGGISTEIVADIDPANIDPLVSEIRAYLLEMRYGPARQHD